MYPDVDVIRNGSVDEKCNDYRAKANNFLIEYKPDIVFLQSNTGVEVRGGVRGFELGLDKEIKFAVENSKHVVVIGSVPGSGDLNTCLPIDRTVSSCLGKASNRAVFRDLERKYSAKYGAKFFDPTPFLCRNYICPPYIGSTPTYLDGHHLNPEMSKMLVPFFEKFLIEQGLV